jgi:hypothetical protein
LISDGEEPGSGFSQWLPAAKQLKQFMTSTGKTSLLDRQVATPGMRSAEKPISADGETSAR